MRVFAAAALIAAATAACGGGGLFQHYEYEEDVYLSLDGAATVYVNSSVAALDALRGAAFDTRPSATIDRDRVRTFFSTAITRPSRISTSRRSGRRFVHVRVDVDNIRRLGEAGPFSWSTYRFARDGDLYTYRQAIGASARKDVGAVGWTGRELVAFRLHLPSKIAYHNAPPGNLRRGNILVWEQSLSDRLEGVPLELETRIEMQSILYRTLWLFGATFAAVALTFVAVIWRVRRAGTRRAAAQPREPGALEASAHGDPL